MVQALEILCVAANKENYRVQVLFAHNTRHFAVITFTALSGEAVDQVTILVHVSHILP